MTNYSIVLTIFFFIVMALSVYMFVVELSKRHVFHSHADSNVYVRLMSSRKQNSHHSVFFEDTLSHQLLKSFTWNFSHDDYKICFYDIFNKRFVIINTVI